MSRKIEYGDFQTPQPLAERVCGLISGFGLRPAAVVEPICGEGAFLAAAADSFPQALQQRAPRAWPYLLAHREAVARRASTIYRNRPLFSMFGVGAYSLGFT